MRLSGFAQGRDNNFNLIRIIAAFTVLISHCFVLDFDIANGDPLHEIVGISLGLVAVDVFFIASGFLVTASLLKEKAHSNSCGPGF